jgi:hypothetical protein
MSKIDRFESVFRSAVKDVFAYKPIDFQSILVVTDLSADQARILMENIKAFASVIHIDGSVDWQVLSKDDFRSTMELLTIVEKQTPDLIFTYRNLFSEAWRYPHSLGEHLDVLVQIAKMPVVVVPHPEAGFAHEHAMMDTDTVMVVTDHLANDHDLVNYGLRFTQNDGMLYLVHIEPADIFEHYIDAISKIESIDTELATTELRQQLLKEPRDYIKSVSAVIDREQLPIQIRDIVQFGHHLTEYRQLIEANAVDLLVMNTKDKQQMAMHGNAYPLAVELRQIPLLLI